MALDMVPTPTNPYVHTPDIARRNEADARTFKATRRRIAHFPCPVLGRPHGMFAVLR
jgi:hypothetical protein